MAYVSNYVDVDCIDDDDLRSEVFEDYTVNSGVLITEGTEAARVIVEAFPHEGYMMSDAYALRDLILKFNAEHGLSPTVL